MKPKLKIKPRVKRIVQTGDDRSINHRADFKHCPSCDHAMEHTQWDKAAVTLILDPSYYKAGSVTVVSECPKCFELSWVHESMSSFQWNEAWPEDWKQAVEKREAAVKLEAVREWGASLCHNCHHLTDAKIDHHAWRNCILGSGPARKECAKYLALV